MPLPRSVRPVAAVLAALLAAAAAVLAPAAAVAAVAAPARAAAVAPAASVVSADPSDFSFLSFDAVYELSADEDGHSVLHTTETLVAVFPETDQNRGIRRALPLDYDGHPTDLSLRSVTDLSGEALAYETEE